jgi:putative DNA primase/helicase
LYQINFTLTPIIPGSIQEQCLFVLHGDGGNGKSTFVDTITTLLGDYGSVAAPEILVKRRSDQHPTEIVNLKGARFVAVNETEKGRSLDENRVKMITGETNITSRFMRGDFFTFKQEYTFWLCTNNKPNIKGTDKGIWRRIRLIPFENTISDKTIDHQLLNKLGLEMPCILNWAIEGCLKWQKEGLDAPIAVAQATEEYRSDQDALGRFIDECCELDVNARIKTSELFKAYKTWCDENGERAEKNNEFGKNLRKRDFKPSKSGSTRFFNGIQLLDRDGSNFNRDGFKPNDDGGLSEIGTARDGFTENPPPEALAQGTHRVKPSLAVPNQTNPNNDGASQPSLAVPTEVEAVPKPSLNSAIAPSQGQAEQSFKCYNDIFELSTKGMSWVNIRAQLTTQYGTALLDVAKEDLITEGLATYNQHTDKLMMLN